MNSSHYLGKRFTVISVSVLLAVLAIGPIQVLEGGATWQRPVGSLHRPSVWLLSGVPGRLVCVSTR